MVSLGQWAVYYTGTQCIRITFSYSLAYQLWGLFKTLIGCYIKWSVQTFQPPIVIYISSNFVSHHWVCTSIYQPLSYPFRSLRSYLHFNFNSLPSTVRTFQTKVVQWNYWLSFGCYLHFDSFNFNTPRIRSFIQSSLHPVGDLLQVVCHDFYLLIKNSRIISKFSILLPGQIMKMARYPAKLDIWPNPTLNP